MLEYRATQNRLAGQPVATARRPRIGAQIGGDLVEQLRVLVQPDRRPFQAVRERMVNGGRIE